MKISYVSDIHLDFWVKFTSNQIKFKQRTEEFILKLIGTDTRPYEVLVIAGDMGHFNMQSLWALEVFSQYYEQVCFTYGNHDKYLISNNQANKYNNHSENRIKELYSESIKLRNVHPLFYGETFTYKGVKFGGCPMWYPLETPEQKMFFYNVSNDSKLIKGSNVELLHARDQEYYEELLEEKVDVMISHFPVINIDSHFKYNSTACYLTPVRDINAKAWIFGHSHEQKVYEKFYCTFYMNAIGYPSEKLKLGIDNFIY